MNVVQRTTFFKQMISPITPELKEIANQLGKVYEELVKINNREDAKLASPKARLTEQELWELTKDEQIILLNSYGITDIPQYEADRVVKLLEVQV